MLELVLIVGAILIVCVTVVILNVAIMRAEDDVRETEDIVEVIDE